LATFIENDFGTPAAQKVIFQTRWFEILLVLFGISIATNIVRFRMIKQKKWAILTFHASVLVILLGAGAGIGWLYGHPDWGLLVAALFALVWQVRQLLGFERALRTGNFDHFRGGEGIWDTRFIRLQM